MIISNLKKMKKQYPTFLDKSDNSNFTKHLKVINSQQLDLYQTLKKLDLSKILNRPLTIKKTQNKPYYQTLEFNIKLENLKVVTIYKNHSIIYQEEYDTENVNNFTYLLDCEKSESIIPDEGYILEAKTYNEYTFQKGYPENDNKQNDIYDHDYSLDVIGNLLNIKRHNFNTVEPYQYYKTLPSYHKNKTEDDYYYMERIKHYISNYNQEFLPILEVWKYYNMKTSVVNRYHILSIQDESFMTPNDTPEGYTLLPNLIQEEYNKFEVSEEYTVPYDLNIIGNSKYYISLDIEKAESPIFIKLYFFDKDGNAVHVETKSQITTDRKINFYTYINTPNNATTVKIKLISENTFKFSNLNFQKLEYILVNDESAKYMRTKTDYNSCVYDMYGSYSDVPSNLRLPVGDEVETLLKRCLPVTKKMFFNILYSPEEEKQHLTIHETKNLKINRKIDNVKTKLKFNITKEYISKRLNANLFYGLEGCVLDEEEDKIISTDEYCECITPLIGLDNLIKIDTDAVNMEILYYHAIGTYDGIIDYEILTFNTPSFILDNFDATHDFIKFKGNNESNISYIHFYSYKDGLDPTDYGKIKLVDAIISDGDELLTIYDSETSEIINEITISNVECEGNVRVESPNIYFDNNLTLFNESPIKVNNNETYTIKFDVIDNPSYLSIKAIQLDENNNVIETTESDFLECPSWKTHFYYTFNTLSRCDKIYFQIIPKTTGVYTHIRNLKIEYEKIASIKKKFQEFKALKIDSNSNKEFTIKTGNGNIFTPIRNNEKSPLIIPLDECKQYLKINTNSNSFEIYGVY